MTKTIKTCCNCKHKNEKGYNDNDVCNLYNKYTVAARILCKMECWEKKPKKRVKVVGDKLIIK